MLEHHAGALHLQVVEIPGRGVICWVEGAELVVPSCLVDKMVKRAWPCVNVKTYLPRASGRYAAVGLSTGGVMVDSFIARCHQDRIGAGVAMLFVKMYWLAGHLVDACIALALVNQGACRQTGFARYR